MSNERIYLSTFKTTLKHLAQAIRAAKVGLKDKQRANTATYRDYYQIEDLKSDYRHMHIAYCLFRGRELSQIEAPGSKKLDMGRIKSILETLQKDPSRKKLYVIADKGLAPSQRAVQAGHALAEYLKTNPENWDNGTLVYLKASSEELQELLRDTQATPFYEEDLGNQLTAIAALGIQEQTSHLPLM